MRATVLQKDLAKVLSNASHFVSTRAQLPILSNLKLVVSGAKLVVEATNLEISISASLGAQVEEDGELAVPARVLTDLVSNLHSEKIQIYSNGEVLNIEADGFKGNIAGLNTADFPEIPKTVKNEIVLPIDSFASSVAQTLFSTSPDDTRPALAGVLMLFADDTLSMVSSDGFRLSKKVLVLKGSWTGKIILPRTILSEIAKVSGNAKKLSVSINEEDKQAVFAVDDMILSSRIVEGEYPPFEKIIPTTSSIVVGVSKDDFQNAVRSASIFARDGASIIKLHAEDGQLVVSAESARSGSQETKVVAATEGPVVEILYNYRYVEEFLNVVKGESVTIKLNSATSSGVFLDSEDEHYLHLIMPVKS